MSSFSEAMKKLTVLADGAKYDVSCSSSGAKRANNGFRGNAAVEGICHSWSADGRCISLLKILLSNKCAYDCAYCVNRRSAQTPRASLEPRELADLTMEFYRRNYIEGLFLSSAVERSPDYTAERIAEALAILRLEYGFYGYIHAKIIPGTSPELIQRVGRLADRLSVNVEVPSRESLKLLAPQKKPEGIFLPMKQITETMKEERTLVKAGNRYSKLYTPDSSRFLDTEGTSRQPAVTRSELAKTGGYKEKFAPAGQTTQMMIGATGESDRQIIKTSEKLYQTFCMKRVYFSAYVPVVQSPVLPSVFSAPPLTREHRLYQADWLMRFYGFSADEILPESHPNFDLELDPKVDWALRNLQYFPVELNRASMEEILRVPGIGNISAMRIVRQRRVVAVRFEDLKKMGVVVKRAKYFLTCGGNYYGGDFAPEAIRRALLPPRQETQLSFFSNAGSAALPGHGSAALSDFGSAALPAETERGMYGLSV